MPTEMWTIMTKEKHKEHNTSTHDVIPGDGYFIRT